MVAKDFNLKPVQENSCFWQGFNDDDETLSFSDLPLNNNNNSSVNWDDDDHFSKEDQNQDNFFEFFSEDFTDSITYSMNNDNIIFCGKLIPHKESVAAAADHDQEIKFTPKSHSSRNMEQEKLFKNCKSFPVDNYHYQKHDHFSRKRASNSVKYSRWFLFNGRFPMEMELRDIKARQGKNQKKMKMFPSDERTDDLMAPSKSSDNKIKKVKNLWGLLRIFASKKPPIK